MKRFNNFARHWKWTLDFYYTHWNLGQVLEMKGLIEEAIAEYEKAMSLDEDPLPPALLGRLFAKTGRREQALTMLDRLPARRHQALRLAL